MLNLHSVSLADELTQEMASRGASLVYNLGDEPTKKALLTALVSTLQGKPQTKSSIKVTEETRIFEKGQIGKAPGNMTTKRMT